MTAKFVAYFRVSTHKQGRSGLGLEAQQAAAEAFVRTHNGELLAQFSEVETGKRNDRPQLQMALALCRKAKAVLLIAKLDRLSRNASFLLNLRDGGVPFTCCDMPEADRFTVGIMALVAERERELISERTRAAMAAAKRRGTRLGNPRLEEARANSVREKRRRAQEFVAKLTPVLTQIREQGRVSDPEQVAECLNARGFTSPSGSAFTKRTVRRLTRQVRALSRDAGGAGMEGGKIPVGGVGHKIPTAGKSVNA